MAFLWCDFHNIRSIIYISLNIRLSLEHGKFHLVGLYTKISICLMLPCVHIKPSLDTYTYVQKERKNTIYDT